MIKVYFDGKWDRNRGYCIAMVDQYGHMFKGITSDNLNFDSTDDCEVGVPNVNVGGPVKKIRNEMHEWFKQVISFDHDQTGDNNRIQFFGYRTIPEWTTFCRLAFDEHIDTEIIYPEPLDLVSVFFAAGYEPDTDICEFSGVVWDESEDSETMWKVRMIEACFTKLVDRLPYVR